MLYFYEHFIFVTIDFCYFQLYMLAAGDCVYKGGVKQLLPYLKSMGLECPPYNNPADYGML
jgi:hypothetical protein